MTFIDVERINVQTQESVFLEISTLLLISFPSITLVIIYSMSSTSHLMSNSCIIAYQVQKHQCRSYYI